MNPITYLVHFLNWIHNWTHKHIIMSKEGYPDIMLCSSRWNPWATWHVLIRTAEDDPWQPTTKEWLYRIVGYPEET